MDLKEDKALEAASAIFCSSRQDYLYHILQEASNKNKEDIF